MAELTRKAQIAAGAAITPLTPGEKLVKTLANPTDTKFVVTLTPTAADFSGTMDYTVAEIDEAYKSGKNIQFKVVQGDSAIFLTALVIDNGGDYFAFGANLVNATVNALVEAWTVTSAGSSNAYYTKVYVLTPAPE